MSKKNGGPAFPHAAGYDFKGEKVITQSDGISLRDYLAGQAMAGILNHRVGQNARKEDIAKLAYDFADAMLEARNANTH